MSSVPTPQEIWKDARWLAQAVDPNAGLIRVVEMSPEAYRDASFLDDRMLERPRNAHLLQWRHVAEAIPSGARTDARWILHIGHVGSTLVSRLLGELDGVLSVREPRALRDLTFFPTDVRAQFIPTLIALLSRTFATDQAALVKATSFVSEIATELIAGDRRALFLYAGPLNYIAGILAGENSRAELAGLAESRRQRLAGRDIHLPQPRHEADLAAAAWACEMTALESAATSANVHWSDFDQLLRNIEEGLHGLAAFFGFEALPDRLKAIASGPLVRRYSKATEYDYSAELRRKLLRDAAARHDPEIDAALAMLDAAAETAPLLKKALERAQAES